MKTPSEKLAAALAEVHAESGMTYEEAVRQTGFDRSTLHRYHSGRITPHLDTLVQLCAGYRVTLREVLERAGLI